MEQDAIKLLGLEGVQSLDPDTQRMPFTFKKDCSTIAFTPEETSHDGWDIKAQRIPPIVSIFYTITPLLFRWKGSLVSKYYT